MRQGEVITAEVVRVDQNFVVVNAGLKSESYVPVEEFLNDQGELEVQPGEFVQVAIEMLEDGYGETRLSRDRAKRIAAWNFLEQALNEGSWSPAPSPARSRVVSPSCPTACAPSCPVPWWICVRSRTPPLRRQDPSNSRSSSSTASATTSSCPVVPCSKQPPTDREKLLRTSRKAPSSRALSRTSPTTAPSWTWVVSTACCTSPTWPGAASVIPPKCSPGDEVTAKILKFDAEKNRVSLGMKQLGEDPGWASPAATRPAPAFGKVTNLTDYGSFVEIEQGIEGLVHVSEMDWTNKNVHPSKVVQLGDEVEVMIPRSTKTAAASPSA